MSEIIWFFGASGAGKASTIKKVAAGDLQLPNLEQQVDICRGSLEWDRTRRKEELAETLGGYALSGVTMLVKGQASDLTIFRTPYKLKQTSPDIDQQVVFVYTDPALLPGRAARRQDDYRPKPDHDFKHETRHQIAEVGALCETLNIQPLIIDNSGIEPIVRPNIPLSELPS